VSNLREASVPTLLLPRQNARQQTEIRKQISEINVGVALEMLCL